LYHYLFSGEKTIAISRHNPFRYLQTGKDALRRDETIDLYLLHLLHFCQKKQHMQHKISPSFSNDGLIVISHTPPAGHPQAGPLEAV
jgi:hypothetical protein